MEKMTRWLLFFFFINYWSTTCPTPSSYHFMSCLISVLTLYASWAGWQKAKPGILCILIWCPCLIRNLEFPPLKPCRQNSVCNTYTYHVDEVVIVPNSTCLPQSAPGMHHALCSSVQLPALLLALFLYSVSIQVLVWVIRRNFKCSQLKKKKKGANIVQTNFEWNQSLNGTSQCADSSLKTVIRCTAMQSGGCGEQMECFPSVRGFSSVNLIQSV